MVDWGMRKVVFTIGHSTHTIERFVALLITNGVTALADVRSSPYSRFNPQFNRESLKASLANKGIKYVFLGEELGARSEDPGCYIGQRVQYDRVARTEQFKRGIRRLQTGMQDYKIALMCAEKDPLECHRTILVARELERVKVSVEHILESGKIETHQASMKRLIKELKFENADLFLTEEENLNRAYDVRGEAIAYTREPPKPLNTRKYQVPV